MFSFVKDASRFILEFRHIIEIAPLQIYASALVFSPQGSIIRRLFSHLIPAWIETLPTVDKTWTASLQSLEGHSAPVVAIAFSHNGRLLASGSEDHSVRLWDPATGSSRGTLEGHSSRINAVGFSSNDQLASASDDKSVRLWDPVTGKCQGILWGHEIEVIAIRFFHSGQFLASVSSNGSMDLWDLNKGTTNVNFRILLDDNEPVMNISPDGDILAFISKSHSVNFYNLTTGTLKTLERAPNISIPDEHCVISPNGQLLAFGSYESSVQLWDLSTGCSRGRIEGRNKVLRAIIFSPKSQLLVTLSNDGGVRLWNSVGELQCNLQGTLNGFESEITKVIFSPDGRLLATTSLNYIIRLWDVASGTCRGRLGSNLDDILQLAFSPDGQLLTSASADHIIRLWDPVIKTTRRTLEVCSGIEVSDSMVESHSSMAKTTAISPSGQLLASGYRDGTIKLWNSVGVLQDTFKGHTDEVRNIIFSPSGQLLLSKSEDMTIKLWDVVTKRCDVLGDNIVTFAMAFSASGQFVACALLGYIRFWDITPALHQGTYQDYPTAGFINQIVFSSNDELLASMHCDGVIRLWDFKNGRLIRRIVTHLGRKLFIRFDGSKNHESPTSSDESHIALKKTPSISLDGYCLRTDGFCILSLERIPQMQGVAHRSYVVDSNWQWVNYKGRHALWLPTKFRTTKYAVNSNSLALWNRSGQVTVVGFSTTNTPPKPRLSTVPLSRPKRPVKRVAVKRVDSYKKNRILFLPKF